MYRNLNRHPKEPFVTETRQGPSLEVVLQVGMVGCGVLVCSAYREMFVHRSGA